MTRNGDRRTPASVAYADLRARGRGRRATRSSTTRPTSAIRSSSTTPRRRQRRRRCSAATTARTARRTCWASRTGGRRGAGVVVGYQPGEYQPHALDDLDGNNFQILANAILYAAGIALGPIRVDHVERTSRADDVQRWSAEGDYAVCRSTRCGLRGCRDRRREQTRRVAPSAPRRRCPRADLERDSRASTPTAKRGAVVPGWP